ncbi:MAG: Type 1 glutamine amidotransferase-like domain-containing protein [Lachnospiraceae bacterium]|nr:Type 1 glutamine amidotransferase-like domain-containing protein [Lachnospiraceae bacterium]
MKNRSIFLTSDGLSQASKVVFLEQIGKKADSIKLMVVPTAGILSDSAREGLAVCLSELMAMGIKYENITVYNLELVISKGYVRTYSAYISEISPIVRLVTADELASYDAIVISGGDASFLTAEMNRTGFATEVKKAVDEGLVYVGISAGSMFGAGSFENGLQLIKNAIIPHWNNEIITTLPNDDAEIRLSDGQVIYASGNRIELL